VVDNKNVLGGIFGTCASVFSFFKLTIHFVFFSLHIINESHKYIHYVLSFIMFNLKLDYNFVGS